MPRSGRSAPDSPSPKGRSGTRAIIISCSPTCRPTCAAAGTRARRARGHAAVEQMQRHDLRRRPQSDRVRARDLDAGARAAGRAARSGRLAFRGHGAQQPERRLHPFRRLDLFFRSLVRPHAGLRRRASAPARLSGRLSRAAGGGAAAARCRSLHVRSAERALLLARREAALCQRHGAGQYPRVRRQAGRLARDPDAVRRRPQVGPRAGRARRHEMRFDAAMSGSPRRAASGCSRRAAI